jgi:cysteine desulfurase
MTTHKVYLDHAASTPVDPRVIDVMSPYFMEHFGNPSSVHHRGQVADHAVMNARQSVAEILGCSTNEVIFTSCGTESDNLALRGTAFAERERRGANHILTTAVEHPAVLRTANALVEQHGFELEMLPIDSNGYVTPKDLARALRPDTAIVSVIYGNNEIGTLNPIPTLGTICREHGVPFHTDAVQTIGQAPIDVETLHVDLLSISGHKFYAPKGIGALYIREGIDPIPMQTGGSHEQGLRAGTLNVPLIVGLSEAMKLAIGGRDEFVNKMGPLRDHMIEQVLERVPDSQLTGHPTQRLSNHASFIFKGIEGNQLLAALDIAGFACSSGSACKTGDPEPSKVLTALGYSHKDALGSLRVTLGRTSTKEEIDAFLESLPAIISRLRSLEDSIP